MTRISSPRNPTRPYQPSQTLLIGKQREGKPEYFAKLESAPFSDEMLQREETRELVNAAMSQLPPHYRQALESKYVSGESVRVIAERWRMTEKATESLLTRARQAFRAAFVALCRNLEVELQT